MAAAAQEYQEAFAAYQAGDHARARAMLERGLARAPHDAASLLLLGVVQDKADAALSLALLERACWRDPAHASAWYNLAVVEAERGNLAAAAAAYRRCIGLEPTHLEGLGNGAEVLRRLEEFDDALAWADRRLALQPGHWPSVLNRAVCLFQMRRFEAAHAAFAQARTLSAGAPIVEWERFGPLLHEKQFGDAWDAFAHRFAIGHLTGVFHYPFEFPLWRGESLSGKHILIHNEQGLGDQIMFACAVPEVIAAARAVTLVVAPTLVDVFAASFPQARVLPARFGRFAGDHPIPEWIGSLGDIDVHAPIGSLMAILRREAARFAEPRAYLRPSAAARARWAAFDPGRGLKVGLCWASNPALFRRDSAARAVKKSMAFDALAPLGDLGGARFVSVLNWPLAAEQAPFAAAVTDLSDRLESFDDTAALIEHMDVIVTVDTAVAHMAGALGKETWLMLHDLPDARWEMTASRSYWYPNMRLFRQQSRGDWGAVVSAIGDALHDRIGA
ncbi:MAG: tetratricopeptide repeat protein [Caulobacterales bacterium]